ncbi:DEAD/DEAH box helicase [Arthrobacter mobilis]|uniref:DEAD/DEAH box helicase n=1 Tax=Arthrobacter mobilis TaxID=2724944 RepID=A0A7X6HDR4_9MICC|nr:DEAD/DEAH box helicase [Arthrobacter mobilis]NKX54374.1 DEAD/DEAH box helicase [Arthrobacter mobilis]
MQGIDVRRPSSDLPGLDLSMSPLDLSLQIRHGHNDVPFLVAVPSDDPSGPELTELPTGDQLIHADTWYFVDVEQTMRLSSQLEAHQIRLGSTLSDQAWLWLLWQQDLEVVDSKTHPAINTAAASGTDDGVPVPEIAGRLYPYQTDGYGKLLRLNHQGIGCLLADEMGLGKTLQVIATLAAVRDTGPSLVVCPASTMSNWLRELRRFAPQLSCLEHRGQFRSGSPATLRLYDVVVTTYETLNRDIFMFEATKWSIVALDEAQYIKNGSTSRSQNVKRLPRVQGIAVSGTPIENSLTDLWSISEFVAPQFLPKFEDFCAQFPDETWAAKEVGRRVAPLTIRRTVDQVADDLPERTDTYFPIHCGGPLAHEYQSILTAGESPLATVTRLRVACASLVPEKLDALGSILEGAFARNDKVIIFAPFTETIDGLLTHARQNFPGIFVEKIDGRTNVRDRQKIIDEFTGYGEHAILVLNPRAAGVGINIQAANVVVHWSPEWNPAIIDQASARAYRRGQAKPVFVYYFYFEQTVEEYMIDKLSGKRELSAAGLTAATDTPEISELKSMLSMSPVEDSDES